MPTVVWPAHRNRHLELGAHAVGARTSTGSLYLPGEQPAGKIELKQAREPVFQGDYARRKRPRSCRGSRDIDSL